jgi:hypothetical protein
LPHEGVALPTNPVELFRQIGDEARRQERDSGHSVDNAAVEGVDLPL